MPILDLLGEWILIPIGKLFLVAILIAVFVDSFSKTD